jgi:hypothetical protein
MGNAKEQALEKVCGLLVGNLHANITILEDLVDQLYVHLAEERDMEEAVEKLLDHEADMIQESTQLDKKGKK